MASSIKTMTALVLILGFVPAADGKQPGRCKLQGAGIDRCIVLRAAAENIPVIAHQYQLSVVRRLSSTDPDAVLVEAPVSFSTESTLSALLQDPEVLGAERVALASLPESSAGASFDSTALAALDAVTLDGLYTGGESDYFIQVPWNGYLLQPATSRIRLAAARDPQVPETWGTGVVAIIDSGVDPDHPMLQGSLVAGYDMLLDEAGVPSEWSALDASTRDQTRQNLTAISDQSYATILEGDAQTASAGDSIQAITDQSYATILESEPLPAAFGHGTMVAGLVRLVAPGAKLMPLRVFGGDGTASTADVIEAIYFAIENGADVINMSFSMDTESPELARAIARARQAGLVCVSSAGNLGTAELTYPAALSNVLGVASTDDFDRLSPFSNYGSELVTVGAPGEAIVSLYPGGLYAGGWGTSFSSALVSGAVALLHSINGSGTLNTVTLAKADSALAASSDEPDLSVPSGAIGHGRLDVEEAFVHGLSNNGNGQ